MNVWDWYRTVCLVALCALLIAECVLMALLIRESYRWRR